ncbi:class A beta-lactamase-related serine hydrolase [Nocardia stercoris]|uniref:Class A beta-lactamase-related serine hydrolase n=2 Tax=Nocardia stercoris TaxID=2483361 RepID=A0A3M2LAU9_9NOCA|nr:class A beta-lactamase-related serine hydrolase [Nocardia stercoris]
MVPIDPDLAAVTTVGYEDDPRSAGVEPRAVDAIWESVREWYRMGTTPTIQVCLRRKGKIVLNRSIGYGWGNGPKDGPEVPKRLVTPESPLCGFSTAKGVSAAVVAMLIEQHAFAPDEPVCTYIPEFAANGKAAITIGDVLSHSAGIPFVTPPFHGTEMVLDEDEALRGLAALRPSSPPGRFRVYHAMTAGLVLRLLVQRATGKRLREHLREQVLDPLGFRWTDLGVRPEDVDLVVPSVPVGPGPSKLWQHLSRRALGGGLSKPATPADVQAFLTAELPSGNLVTTAAELSRFYEILGRGGELDGVRIMRPETVAWAVRPARWIPGVAGRVSVAGYELGAARSKFGRHTESHFGRSGLTTQYGWADPARAMSGAILTSGKARSDMDRPYRLVAQISGLFDRVR